MTMTTYNITANGIDMGDFTGATERDALEAYARAVGYSSIADLAATLDKTEQQVTDELSVEAL